MLLGINVNRYFSRSTFIVIVANLIPKYLYTSKIGIWGVCNGIVGVYLGSPIYWRSFNAEVLNAIKHLIIVQNGQIYGGVN